MKQYVVIAYDIQNDKSRIKVSKFLESLGRRVNYSVFECLITEKQLIFSQIKLKKLMDQRTDSVLYYYLCKSCFEKRENLGQDVITRNDIVWI